MRVVAKLETAGWKAGSAALLKRTPKAIKRALKRSATTGRAAMAKEITKDTGLAAKRVKDEIKVVEVGSTAIQLVVTGRRLPLIEFRARGPEPSRGRGRGVSYRGQGGGSRRIESAFITTMSTGHRGVFQRKSTGRTPIRELFGPSLVRVFRKFLPLGAAKAEEALAKNLKHEFDFAAK